MAIAILFGFFSSFIANEGCFIVVRSQLAPFGRLAVVEGKRLGPFGGSFPFRQRQKKNRKKKKQRRCLWSLRSEGDDAREGTAEMSQPGAA